MVGSRLPNLRGISLLIELIDRLPTFRCTFLNGIINFDTWWKTDPDAEGHITDCGFCPEIELRAGIKDIVQNTEFTESIMPEEVEHILIRSFYKSQHINWVSLEEALEMAPAQQKPIHAISIDGPLFDESC